MKETDHEYEGRSQLRLLLRLEGLSMTLVGMAGAWNYSATLWQVAVFAVAPDLWIAGYVLGAKYGASIYNVAHIYVLPLLMVGFRLLIEPSCLPIVCIWLMHIGIDRALGYGLKSETGFSMTHLGPMGRAG